MSETKTTAVVARQAAPTVLSCVSSDTWKQEVAKAIPKEIALEAMLRVARSAASDPKFANCDPKSFLLALLKCARAGLYPDGREAHLIAFGKEVQAVFDWKGLVALASRAGTLVTPKLVHDGDEFTVEEDDGNGKTKVTHRVDYRKPRGEIQLAYSRALLPNGNVDYEFMSADEVEQTRQSYSRAKDSTPWTKSWGEMAKKTVIKRHSKRWDMSPEIRQALNADDDTPPALGEARVSAPIFSSPLLDRKPEKITPQEEGVTDVESKSEALPATVIKDIRAKLNKHKVSEKELIEFVAGLGVFEVCGSLEEVHAQSDSSLGMISEQMDDIINRMKYPEAK